MDEMMIAPVFAGEGKMVYEERPTPLPEAPDDVIVAIRACGICGTDLNILAVPPAHKALPGIVLGHEGVGTVVATAGGVRGLAVGDRVAIARALRAGIAATAGTGWTTSAKTIAPSARGQRRVRALSHAPASALYRISDAVSDDDAVFFEPLSCVVGVHARPYVPATAWRSSARGRWGRSSP